MLAITMLGPLIAAGAGTRSIQTLGCGWYRGAEQKDRNDVCDHPKEIHPGNDSADDGPSAGAAPAGESAGHSIDAPDCWDSNPKSCRAEQDSQRPDQYNGHETQDERHGRAGFSYRRPSSHRRFDEWDLLGIGSHQRPPETGCCG